MKKLDMTAVGLIASLVVISVLGIFNVNSFVARYNYEAYTGSGVTIDVDYMSKLGDEGVKYLYELTHDKNQTVASEAKKALDGARAAFGGSGDMSNVPTTKKDRSEFEGEGLGLLNLLKELKLIQNTSEGFRTVEQGGLSLQGEKVTDPKMKITLENFDEEGKLLIQKGKKKFHMVELG